jgi:hypothetical protein
MNTYIHIEGRERGRVDRREGLRGRERTTGCWRMKKIRNEILLMLETGPAREVQQSSSKAATELQQSSSKNYFHTLRGKKNLNLFPYLKGNLSD